ncbi:hypothetical protein OIU84_000967 [Salix udensis]|uniref:Uncharacterized protein n=1 Tax=Salix udensis TaxID=889485 RepID=A0AAD6L5Z5_9ROSI|nr:hypothetical protein OIU84_000967 [Salix udensis]
MYGANIPLRRDPLKHGHVRKDPLQLSDLSHKASDGPDSISSRESTLPTAIWWRLMKGEQQGFPAVFKGAIKAHPNSKFLRICHYSVWEAGSTLRDPRSQSGTIRWSPRLDSTVSFCALRS